MSKRTKEAMAQVRAELKRLAEDYLRARAQLRKEGFSKENAAFFAEKELREGRRINLEGETKARYLSRTGFRLEAEEEDSE